VCKRAASPSHSHAASAWRPAADTPATRSSASDSFPRHEVRHPNKVVDVLVDEDIKKTDPLNAPSNAYKPADPRKGCLRRAGPPPSHEESFAESADEISSNPTSVTLGSGSRPGSCFRLATRIFVTTPTHPQCADCVPVAKQRSPGLDDALGLGRMRRAGV